ncbi:unnamed protein product [Soboliphyme baturini]|uniref:Secreted protein n=1 Tax=Soboliphyme baturini TaxID=241478 RepID=A0A183IEK8_9BILA|nr:unnamed protein product [Soboliphyme baturini]
MRNKMWSVFQCLLLLIYRYLSNDASLRALVSVGSSGGHLPTSVAYHPPVCLSVRPVSAHSATVIRVQRGRSSDIYLFAVSTRDSPTPSPLMPLPP